MPPLNHAELAWEFADLFSELDPEQINEILAKNVPLETLDFFQKYAETFAGAVGIEGDAARRIPNLLLMGYLLRVLEERLIDDNVDVEADVDAGDDGEGEPEA